MIFPQQETDAFPKWLDLARLIAQIISSLTASLRSLGCDIDCKGSRITTQISSWVILRDCAHVEWSNFQHRSAQGFDGALNVDITECLDLNSSLMFVVNSTKQTCLVGFAGFFLRSFTPCRCMNNLAGSRPISSHIRVSTSCWPPMLRSSLQRRPIMSSSPWQRSPCLSSSQHRWWSSAIHATANTWPAAWCTAESRLEFLVAFFFSN